MFRVRPALRLLGDIFLRSLGERRNASLGRQRGPSYVDAVEQGLLCHRRRYASLSESHSVVRTQPYIPVLP